MKKPRRITVNGHMIEMGWGDNEMIWISPPSEGVCCFDSKDARRTAKKLVEFANWIENKEENK